MSFGSRHRKPTQELIKMLRNAKVPEIVVQYRAIDVDCLIDTAAAFVGEDKVTVKDLRSGGAMQGAFYSIGINMPVKLTLPRTNQFEQPPTFNGVIKIIYECFSQGFMVRSSVREADLGVYRSLAPLHGAKVRNGLLEKSIVSMSPYTTAYFTGDFGASLVNKVANDLRNTGVHIESFYMRSDKAFIRDINALKKAEKRYA